MLPIHPAKKHPHLWTYLHHARSRGGIVRAGPPPKLAGLVIGAVTFLTTATYLATSFPVALLVMLAGWIAGSVLLVAARPPLSPAELRQQEAREVARRVQRSLELHRLHRDLDPASLALLDEAARFWDEARRQDVHLDGPMLELLHLYGPLIPDEPKPRAAMEWVEEAVETFQRKGDPRMPPLWFNEARAIAEDMRGAHREARDAWSELKKDTESVSEADTLRERFKS